MIITWIELKFNPFSLILTINLIEWRNREKSQFFSSQLPLVYGKIETIRNGGESKWNHIWLESLTA